MKIPAPALAIAAISTLGLAFAFSQVSLKPAFLLASSNLIFLIWATRNKHMASHWRTALIAAAPILLLAAVCIYLFRIAHADALVAIAVGFYWLVHLIALAPSFGIARAYHESTQPARA